MTTSHTVTARREFRCDDFDGNGRVHLVQPGQEYARHVAFPGDSDLGNTDFWVLRLCVTCQTRYGRSMPPRRRSRLAAGEGDQR
jgi:hypothetical protein